MKTELSSKRNLTAAVLARLLASIPALGLLFFLPARTLAYWEAWVYLAILFIPITLVAVYLLKNDPALLKRRLQMRERQSQQKWIVGLFSLFLLLTFTFPGFDKRFGWSATPAWAVLIADLIVLLGYGFSPLALGSTWGMIPGIW
jgi:protein-S-isoprenylcysteine O-methyltransferase Ste14